MRARRAPRIALPAESLRNGDTVLRQWREDDVDALVALCQDPEIVRWIRVPVPYTRDDARAYLNAHDPAARAGSAAHLAITAAGDGAPLGSISLLRFCWPDRRGEVGYWLGAPGRGRGHATRAVKLICQWGFRALSLERIELQAATGNPASQQVAQRAGFTREAVLRSYVEGADQVGDREPHASHSDRGRHDLVCFGLLATDPLR